MSNLRPAVAEIERVAPKSRKLHDPVTWGWNYAGVCGVVCGAILYIAFYVYSVSQLVAAWRSGDANSWNLFWHDPFNILLLYPAFILFRMYAKQMPNNPFAGWDRLAEAHWKALEDNGAHIPLAEPQPKPDPDDSPAIAHRVLTPLIRPKRLRDSGIVALATCFFVTAFVPAIIAIVLFFAWVSGLNPDAGPPLLILTGTVVCSIAAGYAALHWFRRTSAPISVAVDREGLHWRESTGRHSPRHIAWSQAQAFMTFSWRNESTYTTYTVYALIAPHAVFTWELTQRANRKERHTHEELAGLIVARTGLPLRTLTETFEAALAVPAAPEKPKIRFPLGTPGTPDAVPGIPPVITAPEPPEVAAHAHRRQLWLRAGAVATIVPLLLLEGTGFGLQHLQPRYFDALLTQAEAQSPLYLDILNWQDGDWPVQQGTPSDPRNYSFTEPPSMQGVYQLSGTDPKSDMYAWEPQSFSDAVVEVTTRYPKNAPSKAIGGIGLILREHGDGSQFVEFQVDPWGDWELWDFSQLRGPSDNWRDIADGHSSAIHLGVSGVNRLAVLMRGDQFILYVNNVFVGAETDSSAPLSGPAGVYVDNDSPGGQFSDFTVYPLSTSLPYLF